MGADAPLLRALRRGLHQITRQAARLQAFDFAPDPPRAAFRDVADVLDGLRKAGIGEVPVVVGGIIPPGDAEALIQAGVARVYTPKDFDLTQIMRDVVTVVDQAWKKAA